MLLLLIPPVAKPCEPMVGAYSLARLARQQGIDCSVIDCSLEWVHHRIWDRFRRAGRPLAITARGRSGSTGSRADLSVTDLPTADPLRSWEATPVASGWNSDERPTHHDGRRAGPAGHFGSGERLRSARRISPAGGFSPVGTRLQRALGHVGRGNPLTRFETYENADRYRQAVEHLEVVLRKEDANRQEEYNLAVRGRGGDISRHKGGRPRQRAEAPRSSGLYDALGPDDGTDRRTDTGPGAAGFTGEIPGLANFEVAGLRAVSRGDLLNYASRRVTVFDDYLEQRLLPQIGELRPETIGFSLTFLHQAFAAVRFATRIRERYPRIRLILGGPMAACWRNADWSRPPLDLFDAVFSAWPGQHATSAGSRVVPFVLPPGQVFYPDPRDLPERSFFAPRPVLPMAFGLGCSWGRCTFCPDYQTVGRRLADEMRDPLPEQLGELLADRMTGRLGDRLTCRLAEEASGRLSGEPRGWVEGIEAWLAAYGPLVIHLTDSCVDPCHLDRLARVISERQWPVRWYAFVRFTDQLAEPGRLERWAEGGCGLLEFGLETAAEELLRKMNKGISLARAAEVLHRSAGAGIRNYVYLLFGFPSETIGHQQETLEFVLRHQDAIHYLNNAILNLPRGSPIARSPRQFGIDTLTPFPGEDGDLSLYIDFRDSLGSARQRARRFLQETFLPDPAVRSRVKAIPPLFKSNHAIFAA